MRAWIARHVDAVGCGLLSLLVGFVWYSVWARIPWPWPAVAAVVAVGALAWLLEEARRHLLGELRIHHQQILDGAVDVLRFRSGEGGAIGVPGQPSTPRTMGPSLDQGAYAEILEGDRVRIARDFEFDPRSSDDVEGFTCRRCHRRARKAVVTHPIWDGPFEGSGSGVVDERVVPFCVRCDVSAPLEGLACSWHAVEAFADGVRLPGLPVRIPWLDQLPVRLHSELFDRVTFHRLPIKVERWRPPVPDEAGHQVLEGAVIDPHFFESGKPIVALDEIPDPLCARCGLTIHDPIHGAAAGEAWAPRSAAAVKPRGAVWQYIVKVDRRSRRYGGRGDVVTATLVCGHRKDYKASKLPKPPGWDPTGACLGFVTCIECTQARTGVRPAGPVRAVDGKAGATKSRRRAALRARARRAARARKAGTRPRARRR